MSAFPFPKLIAHRGASFYAPENTLAAFELAHEMGAKAIETDIMLTKDNVPIVMHDNNLKRTTHFKAEVGDVLWQDIAKLNAGKWKGIHPYLDEPIPTFDALLRFIREKAIAANIELKPYSHRRLSVLKQREISYRTADVVLKHLLLAQANGPLPGIVLSSFDLDALRYLRKHDCPWAIGLLLDTWPEHIDALIDEIKPCSVHLNEKEITPEHVALLKKRGLKILAYTVDSHRRATQLYELGVDSVFTNKPDLLK